MTRDDDEAFEEADDRPRRRRQREDEDEYEDEERPRRRRDEDDEGDEEDRPRRRRRLEVEMNWLDQQFVNTSMVLLVLFPLCCGIIALAFGIAGVVGCNTAEGKQRAWIVLGISIASVVLSVIATVVREVAGVR